MSKTIVGIATLVMSFAFVPSAQANAITINHGKDIGKGNSDTNVVRVVDKECDGNKVYLHYFVRTNGKFSEGRVDDYNGCAEGGASVKFTQSDVVDIKLCEDAKTYSCTQWYEVEY